METKTDKVMSALHLHSSKDFKRLQAGITQSANTIKKDVLTSSLTGILSDSEIATLKKAAGILFNVKGKVEVAKERKARQELERQKVFEQHNKIKQRFLLELLPPPSSLDDIVPVLIWRLSSIEYFRNEISRFCRVGSFKSILSDVELALSEAHHWTLSGVANTWWRDVNESLLEDLWSDDGEPDRMVLENILRNHEQKWRPRVEVMYNDLIERVKREVWQLKEKEPKPETLKH